MNLICDGHAALVGVRHGEGVACHACVQGRLEGGVAHDVARRPRVFGYVQTTRHQLHGRFGAGIDLGVGARGVFGQTHAAHVEGIRCFRSEAPRGEAFAVKDVFHQIDAGHQSLLTVEVHAHFRTCGVPHDVHEVAFAVFQISAVYKRGHGPCGKRVGTLRMHVRPVVDHGDVVRVDVAPFRLGAGVKLHPKGTVQRTVAIHFCSLRVKGPNHAFRSVRDASKIQARLNVERLGQIQAFLRPYRSGIAGWSGGQFHTAVAQRSGRAVRGVGGHLGRCRHGECQSSCEG